MCDVKKEVGKYKELLRDEFWCMYCLAGYLVVSVSSCSLVSVGIVVNIKLPPKPFGFRYIQALPTCLLN